MNVPYCLAGAKREGARFVYRMDKMKASGLVGKMGGRGQPRITIHVMTPACSTGGVRLQRQSEGA